MPLCEIILYPVLVQGENAPNQICAAIEYFNKIKDTNLLIVGRGGGSLEELWAFNDERVARAIFKSEIPIISAVGHETDFTIADFVADLRAPTPSAAAELSVPDKKELLSKISNIKNRLIFLQSSFINSKKQMLIRYSKSPFLLNPMRYIDEKRQLLDFLSKNLLGAFEKYSQKKREPLSVLAAKLNSLSPLLVLGRGYNITVNGKGQFIKSVKEIKKGDVLTVRFKDGSADCSVLERKSYNNG
jgi:exodeoxyribonuclease VII large subunit